MAVVVYIDTDKGVNKAAQEAVTYAKKVAEKVGGDVIACTSGSADGLAGLGDFGASKVITANTENSDPQQITRFVSAVASDNGAKVIVFSQDPVGKAVAPRVAAKMDAGHAPGAIDVPNTDAGFRVKTNTFSGKAFSHISITSDVKVISLLPNSLPPASVGGSASVEAFNGDLGSAGIKVLETKGQGGALSLPEAELVVSAGRGLKGPENWGIVEDLAKELGAATACSRPVADIGWRPHHEHVGQTGVAIRPNLYIAAGISGAIQHLAGVNGSKTIVVINTDAEAPFFKAADYGVVGDAFEVLPRLTEAVKNFNANN
jgi:electron transfer flavoprotein alpha subunit